MNMYTKSLDITALGECLIDFVQTDKSDQLGFKGNPGGAPANMLASACKFGMKCTFIGKVGSDMFGSKLIGDYMKAGIDASSMIRSSQEETTLAFVVLDSRGDRDFFFYRRDTADCMLSKEDINTEAVKNAKFFHFGSVSMTSRVSKEATMYAVDVAKEAGCFISFDPNYRELLWPSPQEAREAIWKGISKSDIVKLSETELELLFGKCDVRSAAECIVRDHGISIVVVTLGKEGSFCVTSAGDYVKVDAYEVNTIDTTGAGDAFFGAFVSGVIMSGKRPDGLDKDDLQHILRMASVTGSLSTSKYGAIPSLPDYEEVLACLQ